MDDPVAVLTAQVVSLRQSVEELTAELRGGRRLRPVRAAPPAPAPRAMVTASRVDQLYGLAKGTAAAAYRAGMVRGREVAGKGRTGRVVKISAADADAAWGGQYATGGAR